MHHPPAYPRDWHFEIQEGNIVVVVVWIVVVVVGLVVVVVAAKHPLVEHLVVQFEHETLSKQ